MASTQRSACFPSARIKAGTFVLLSVSIFMSIKWDCACLLMGWFYELDYPRAARLKSSTRQKISNHSYSAKLETDLCCGLESGTREVFNKHLPYWLRIVLYINH